MSGIAGFSDFESNLSNEHEVIGKMSEAIAHRGSDGEGLWLCTEAALANRHLATLDAVGGQPMVKADGDYRWVITYDGEIFNTKELRYELEHLGHDFRTKGDTEVVLASYIQWGEGCLSRINGCFAFAVWNEREKTLFLARDRFGAKPLFYTQHGSKLIFGSEIKAIMAHPEVEAVIDKSGIAEIFGLGPTHTPGSGVFKDIYELKPAHFLKYSINGMMIRRYWELVSEEHTDTLANTAEKIRYLLRDSVTKQLASDVPLCSFLSGGLDSSAITTIAASQYAFEKGQRIDTYSFDYKDNESFFKKNSFQPDMDRKWVDRVSYEVSSRHKYLTVDTDSLTDLLEKAMTMRDIPGMADIDTSLMYFCSQVKKRHTVALSGECADEIFGGYPWCHTQKALDTPAFPWQHSTVERKAILDPDIAFYTDIDEYLYRRYTEAIEKTPRLPGEEPIEARRREIFYLNLTWFMVQLLDRQDRMSMSCGVQVRAPFCDYRLAEYVWNIPWKMKALGGREKGILRMALKGILPDDIVDRKKSPYPKTYNPGYEEKVKAILTEIVNDASSPLLQLINKRYVTELMAQPADVTVPFFGQLMGMPQLFAYLIQTNMWLKNYNISIR